MRNLKNQNADFCPEFPGVWRAGKVNAILTSEALFRIIALNLVVSIQKTSQKDVTYYLDTSERDEIKSILGKNAPYIHAKRYKRATDDKDTSGAQIAANRLLIDEGPIVFDFMPNLRGAIILGEAMHRESRAPIPASPLVLIEKGGPDAELYIKALRVDHLTKVMSVPGQPDDVLFMINADTTDAKTYGVRFQYEKEDESTRIKRTRPSENAVYV